MVARRCVAFTLALILTSSVLAQDRASLDAIFLKAARLETRKPPDVPAAVRLYEQAARQGHTPSMLRLGYLRQNGVGIPVDLPGALAMFTAAAQAGNSDGQFMLAMSYAEGLGTAKDLVKARGLLLQAASHNQWAQYALGLMMANGEGGAKKLAGARRWLDRAAAGPNRGVAERAAHLRDKIDKILFTPDNSGTALLMLLGAAIVLGASQGGGAGSYPNDVPPSGISDFGNRSLGSSTQPCHPLPIPMGSFSTPNGNIFKAPAGPYYMGGC